MPFENREGKTPSEILREQAKELERKRAKEQSKAGQEKYIDEAEQLKKNLEDIERQRGV